MKERIFLMEDSHNFSVLSGDTNPLHIDKTASRRYISGEPVVHGIHAVLWALDEWIQIEARPVELVSLRIAFLKPIYLGAPVSWSSISKKPLSCEIELGNAGVCFAKIQIAWQRSEQSTSLSPEGLPEPTDPRILNENEVETQRGSFQLPISQKLLSREFPHLAAFLPSHQIAVLLGTSRLVGVFCPGLNSIYTELNLSAADIYREGLEYCVSKYDKRFGLVYMDVSAADFVGTIKAFFRPPPKEQLGFQQIKNWVREGEFSDQRALVIGGSRGLGEVATKLVAAGGGKVRFTYHEGEKDALRILDDLSENGITAHAFLLNVLNPIPSETIEMLRDWGPTHLYYFATPFIFSGRKGVFSSELFKEFTAFYVTGLVNLVDRFHNFGLKHVFYPSSIAIDDLPENMKEYTAAKMAGEIACHYIEKKQTSLKVHSIRLPRLATDQTASIVPVKNLDPVPILLATIRSFYPSARKEADEDSARNPIRL